ncbi:MAG: nucleotidyltransferase domain-containing protein [Planctomycetota bacterium]
MRGIERRSGLSVSTVRQELKKLARLDLLKSRRDGNRLYYSANREHPLFADIHRLVLKTSGLVDVLRRAVGREGVRAAFVFGSVAEGAPDAGSDVDLMVIGDVGLRDVAARLAEASETIGREINPHILRPREFAERRDRNDHFVSSVMDSSKLFVVGTEDDLRAMA